MLDLPLAWCRNLRELCNEAAMPVRPEAERVPTMPTPAEVALMLMNA